MLCLAISWFCVLFAMVVSIERRIVEIRASLEKIHEYIKSKGHTP
jgi:hypothetical protein